MKALFPILIMCAIFGAMAYFHFNKEAAPQTDVLAVPALAPVVNSNLRIATPETSQAAAAAIMGQDVLSGDVLFEVRDFFVLGSNANGVAVVVVDGGVGNGGDAPLSAPQVEIQLIDSKNRTHAPINQSGQYQSGVTLNPLLKLRHFWAFLIAQQVDITEVRFTYKGKIAAAISVRERTPESDAALKARDADDHEDELRAQAEVKFAKATGLKDVQNRAANKVSSQRTDAIWAKHVKAKEALALQSADCDVADRALAAQEKKSKSIASILEDAQEEEAKCKALLENANVKVKNGETNLANAQFRRDVQILTTQLQKARDEQARMDRNWKVAAKDLAEKKKIGAERHAALESARKAAGTEREQMKRQEKQIMALEAEADKANEEHLKLLK